MITEQEKIIRKFAALSLKYHNLSLLFNQLAGSLRIKAKELNTLKEFKIYLKSLNLDVEKIKKLSVGLSDISYIDLKGGLKEDGNKDN